MKKSLFPFISCLLGVNGTYIIYYLFGLNHKLEKIAEQTELTQFDLLKNNPLLWMYVISIIVISIIGVLDLIFTTNKTKDDYARRKDRQRKKYSV